MSHTVTQLTGIMNDTKWDELRLQMYNLGKDAPRFRIKDLGRDEPWPLDSEWFYHFRGASYCDIQWLDLHVQSDSQRQLVHELLRKVHVPGVVTNEGFRVLGNVEPGAVVDYL
jgi:hypothetical protein